MSVTEQNRPVNSDNDIIEIRLSDVVAFLKRSRRAMLLGALLGGILGAFFAYSKPNEYTSQLTVLPEIQSKSGVSLGGSLGSLAGLAGIDVGSMAGSTDAVRPDLYPNVLQSIPFALYMLKKPVSARLLKRTLPLEAFLTDTNKPGFMSRLLPGGTDKETGTASPPPSNSSSIQLTAGEESLTNILAERITGTYDKKTGVLTITAIMQDPTVAADVAQQSLDYLTNYITAYRTEKARREVDFLTKQVAAVKQRYQAAEYDLSAYRDRNRSLFLNTAKIEEQRIQAEFLHTQDLYNTLSKQAEMAKIKVQEETPIFKLLEPARVPLKKSGPKRTAYILGFAVAGLLGGLAFTILKR